MKDEPYITIKQSELINQLSFRDQCAIAAMQGMIGDGLRYDEIPQKAYKMADMMLIARKK